MFHNQVTACLFVEKLKIQRVKTVTPSCKAIELKIGTVDIKKKSDSDEIGRAHV